MPARIAGAYYSLRGPSPWEDRRRSGVELYDSHPALVVTGVTPTILIGGVVPQVVVLLLALLATACGSERPKAPAIEHIPMKSATEVPFSAAVRVGPMLYVSGQLGTDSTLALVPGGIGPETRQAMENIRAIIAQAGGTMDDLVKCTAMLADISEWSAMNREYVKFFQRRLPARSAFGATGLALGARVEIECTAALADDQAERR